MSELNAGQIIDEATRLAGKNEPDAMDLVPMHRWWWRYSQNLDSMLRHALLDHDQMPAALRRLSAQAEPAKDALKWATDFVMQYVHGSEIAGDDIDDLITSLAVRLSASGQGEPREDDELVELWAVVMESIVEIDHGRPMRARDILVSAYDDGLPCQRCPQSTAPAPEKGEAKWCENCGALRAGCVGNDKGTCDNWGAWPAPAQPAPSEEEPGLDEHEAALALTYKIETLINETMACGGGISDSEWRAIVYEELHQFIAGNRSALRSRLSEAPLPLLCDVEEALVDLGACDNPYCTDCPRVLPRVREAIREHAAGTEPAGRIR